MQFLRRLENQTVTCHSRTTVSRLHKIGVTVAVWALTGCAATAPPTLTADSARGREVVMGRDGNCLLCHAVPETGARFMGNLGPALTGIGARLDTTQLRLRLVDPQRFNADSIMPAYARTEALTQVGQAWRGKPILSEQQIEDTVAFLATLR